MQSFNPIEYLCIDVANSYGKDKQLFTDRIQWVKENNSNLENLISTADDPALYVKAVLALREVQAGKPTGHMISLDAICSGIQVMSAITNCIAGGKATGIVDTGFRPDAYSAVTAEMNRLLGDSSIQVKQADAKKAVMTAAYGSTAIPKELFGDNVDVFHEACENVAPGAFQLMPFLVNSWKSDVLHHSWVMADGFEVYIPVIDKGVTRLRVDELGGMSVTFQYNQNKPLEHSKANCANLIHSLDALVLRNMIRRCSYDLEHVTHVNGLLQARVMQAIVDPNLKPITYTEVIKKYVDLAMSNHWFDPVILNHLNQQSIDELPIVMVEKLFQLTNEMLEHKPFHMVTVHDAFRVHPNNAERVRYWYKEILAELAESSMLLNLLRQLIGKHVKFTKFGDIAELIRESNYALS